MEQLRKAGRAIQKFDNDYADAAYRAVAGDPKEDNAVRKIIADFSTGSLTPPTVKFEEGDTAQMKMMGRAYQIGSPVAGFTTRYALPAAGLTAAGKALVDLTSYYGSQADYQEPGQLSM